MAFLTAAAIEIGKAVAKATFKFWLKDSSLGTDISSSLIDLIGKKTSNELAQRKGNRQFEDIGDKIGADVLSLLEIEGIQLDEGESRATALAVAETLNRSKLSSDLLLQINLQPAQLAQYMLTAHPHATRDLSEAATSLYQRIIQECCTYIIDISSHLPSFTEHTFAEILKRDDLILAQVNQVLNDLHEIRKHLNPTDKADRFEIAYRDAVARNLDVLQLIGADVSLPNRRHRLSVAYITLTVASNYPSLQINEDQAAEKMEEESLRDIVSVDSILASSHRLLIRGLAGSGKTTLLQWIAVKAARKSFEGQLSHWNGCIPFYIRLRHYAQTRLPKPESFPDFAAPAVVGTMPEEWVHHVLQSGRAIVLVDGVDEVSASQREDVHSWLRDLVETYKDVYYIVTSRPHAIEEGWMNHEAFNDALLQEMELSDIFTFIDHWHEAVEQELSTDKEKHEIKPLAKHLKQQVQQIRTIRNLATNPLLCAMLCALNRERRQQLPVNRIELYNACCSLLIDRREKESHIDLSDYPTLTEGQKRRLLEDLAYYMIRENLSETEISVADARFKRKLSNMPNVPEETTGKAVRKLLVERTSLIREPVVGYIDFTHRTFQEFFAAQAALDALEIEQLVKNAHNDQWREVILLAAGLASQMQCERLLTGLIHRGDEEQAFRYQLHLLAISCLDTAIELESQVRKELEQRLAELIPPRNLTEAKALSAAGELAVKYLERKYYYNASTRALCIRSLAMIGGEAALEVLQEYSTDTVDADTKELLRAWDKFDANTFTSQILSRMIRGRGYIYLTYLPSYEKLHVLVNSDLTDATSLQLASIRQNDFTPLEALKGLILLRITNCPNFADLSPLAHLTNLTSLEIMYCGSITDLSPLAHLTNLTSLSLNGYYSYYDSIETDYSHSTESIIDLNPLAHLTNLTSLDIIFFGPITDLSPLAHLTSLISLNLSHNKILSDLSPLAHLTNLTSLNLSFNAAPLDLSPLAHLTNLTSLDLKASFASDPSPLAGLTRLKVVGRPFSA